MEVGEHVEEGGRWKVTESGLEWIPDQVDHHDNNQVKKVVPTTKQTKLNAQEQKEMDDSLLILFYRCSV